VGKRYEFGLLGEKLGHSHSPAIHQMLGSCPYELIPIASEGLDSFMRRAPFRGINVTIPYKRRVAGYCEILDEAAKLTGSVNTIVKGNDGRLRGYNTDLAGFLYMAKAAGIEFAGKKVLVLGSGGTGHTAAAAAKREGAGAVVTISRGGPDNYQNLHMHQDADIIVNTTPVGMYPNNGERPVEMERFPGCGGVIDVIYNPLSTNLILDAKRKNIACAGGLSMLVAQAVFAAELFLDKRFPADRIRQTLSTLTGRISNLVLIGMPGCGKSTLAKMAAERLGREFVDIDELIVQNTAKEIPDIFKEMGEEGFRRLEAEAIGQVSRRTGIVISPGAGALMDVKNARALKQNGVLIYIKRDVKLLATEGRPLSSGRGALLHMLKVREPVYFENADAVIENRQGLETALEQILTAFGGFR
jgi:shikimate dehydrogenase